MSLGSRHGLTGPSAQRFTRRLSAGLHCHLEAWLGKHAHSSWFRWLTGFISLFWNSWQFASSRPAGEQELISLEPYVFIITESRSDIPALMPYHVKHNHRVTSHRLCHVLLVRSKPPSPALTHGEGITQRHDHQEVRITGGGGGGSPQSLSTLVPIVSPTCKMHSLQPERPWVSELNRGQVWIKSLVVIS